MDKITVGEVLYVKSTEEPITPVATRKVNFGDKRFPSECEGMDIVVARRPVIADGGVQRYEFYDFLACEVETGFEQTARRITRLKEGAEMYRTSGIEPDGPMGPALVRN
jgi:hypothetical protein